MNYVFGLLDKNISYHTSASDCINALVCVCVCVCTRVLCTMYTETLNAPLPKFSRQGHYILQLSTPLSVEKGLSLLPRHADPLVTSHREIILKMYKGIKQN